MTEQAENPPLSDKSYDGETPSQREGQGLSRHSVATADEGELYIDQSGKGFISRRAVLCKHGRAALLRGRFVPLVSFC
jgi:hypothetical protein